MFLLTDKSLLAIQVLVKTLHISRTIYFALGMCVAKDAKKSNMIKTTAILTWATANSRVFKGLSVCPSFYFPLTLPPSLSFSPRPCLSICLPVAFFGSPKLVEAEGHPHVSLDLLDVSVPVKSPRLQEIPILTNVGIELAFCSLTLNRLRWWRPTYVTNWLLTYIELQ